ncbi:MAG: heavy metal-responsive transcriptional regulator [Proteobacteria bacterium]|nr:heavy metal-responsive transcriptional regulator [Pseudomonadota bacterium]
MNAKIASHFSIGAAARLADVAIDTIRFYERKDLLPAPRRRASGYRDYDIAVIERLRFIRRAKDLGFSLDEIRELLTLSVDRERGVRSVRQRTEARLAEVERRIRELHRVRRGLKRLIDACPGHGKLEACPILSALGGEKDA